MNVLLDVVKDTIKKLMKRKIVSEHLPGDVHISFS